MDEWTKNFQITERTESLSMLQIDQKHDVLYLNHRNKFDRLVTALLTGQVRPEENHTFRLRQIYNIFLYYVLFFLYCVFAVLKMYFLVKMEKELMTTDECRDQELRVQCILSIGRFIK